MARLSIFKELGARAACPRAQVKNNKSVNGEMKDAQYFPEKFND
ncbi:hypothetical protein [Bathymodiolus platifrons methanotrophic gill symbiont]|nr:hypothetical protein [Bathymodiolus platifrons methanotrophic gill symbiont]